MSAHVTGLVLLVVFLVLLLLHLFSRRLPTVLAFVVCSGLAVTGCLSLVVWGIADRPESIVAVTSGAAAGGLGGALLCVIDAFRTESWREETRRALVHSVGIARTQSLASLAARVKAGNRLTDCPFCDSRVLFGLDLHCPQCGRSLEETPE